MSKKSLNKFLFIILLSVCCFSNIFTWHCGRRYNPEWPKVRLENLVGSKPNEVKELIQQIKNPEKFKDLGIDPPNAILLHGLPGTGKTTLAKAIASELDTCIYAISGADLTSCYYGETGQNVGEVFSCARDDVEEYGKPVIILLDELDGVLGGLNTHNDITAKEFLSKMKFEITNTEANKGIYVFATTNHISCFPKALTRSGRFMTIEVPLPSLKDRAEIFKKYLPQYTVEKKLKTEKFYHELAKKTAMFSGADIRETMQKSALKAAYSNQKKISSSNIYQAIENIHEKKHIELRKNKFSPEKSNVQLDELAGAQTVEIQLLLKQLKNPEQFISLGASVPKAVLLYGPPGTGKTTLVRGVANYLGANFYPLSGPDLEDKCVGGATANLELLFNNARKMAKYSGNPSVILIDEMDGAISSGTRREILAKLKYELTEKNENVFVFATTNYPEYFPAALTRPGRFVKIEVPLPNEQDRAEIFKKYANIYKTEKKVKKESFCIKVAKQTNGLSCADIANILERAAQDAGNKNQTTIKVQNILAVVEATKKKATEAEAAKEAIKQKAAELQKEYDEFTAQENKEKLKETLTWLERIKKLLSLRDSN